MDNTEEYTCLSLCSGYGGLELGVRGAWPNIRTIAYVEVEAFAVANLVAKMEAGFLDAAPVWTDIKTFNAEPFRGRVHIITAGYPCQPFSVAGKRQGTDDPRHLWPDIERIIQAVRPVWFFGENVSGHLMLGFPEVYRSLRNMGYSVEAGLFSAAECGAPHRRQRLFFLAHDTSGGFETSKIQQAGQPAPGDDGPELANAERAGEGLRAIERKPAGIGRSRPAIVSKDLADTAAQRIRRPEPEGAAPADGQIDEPCYGRWPARPGQQQYEWEEPRVVDVAGGKKRSRLPGDARHLFLYGPLLRNGAMNVDTRQKQKASVRPLFRLQDLTAKIKENLPRLIIMWI